MRINLVYGTDLPLTDKVSITACLGGRTFRPSCCCCGGSNGVRRAWRKYDRHDPLYAECSKDNKRQYKMTSRGHKDHR